MRIRPLFSARKIYGDEEFVFLVGGGVKNADELLPKLAEAGPVFATGNVFEKNGGAHLTGVYMANLRQINRLKRRVMDEQDTEFYSTMPQARAYPNWRVFSGRIKGLTFDDMRLCKNGGDEGAIMNLAAVLGAKTIVLVGFDLLDIGDKIQAGIITENAKWFAHRNIKVIVTDDDSAIEAYEWRSIESVLGIEDAYEVPDFVASDSDDFDDPDPEEDPQEDPDN